MEGKWVSLEEDSDCHECHYTIRKDDSDGMYQRGELYCDTSCADVHAGYVPLPTCCWPKGEMEKCDACDEPTANPIKGYLASGSILCPKCYDYLDNEVFVYKDEDE